MLFKQKCFRKILNIPHSFVSRISNKSVLEQSGRQEISSILTYRQLVLSGKIAALPSTDVRRQCVFSGQTLRPRIAEQPHNPFVSHSANRAPVCHAHVSLTRGFETKRNETFQFHAAGVAPNQSELSFRSLKNCRINFCGF